MIDCVCGVIVLSGCSLGRRRQSVRVPDRSPARSRKETRGGIRPLQTLARCVVVPLGAGAPRSNAGQSTAVQRAAARAGQRAAVEGAAAPKTFSKVILSRGGAELDDSQSLAANGVRPGARLEMQFAEAGPAAEQVRAICHLALPSLHEGEHSQKLSVVLLPRVVRRRRCRVTSSF